MTGAWWAAAPAMLVSAAILLVPGLIATAPLRLAWVARIALSSAISIACIGIAGVAFSLFGVFFAAWQVVLVALVLGVVAWLIRGWVPDAPRERVRWWWLASAWVLSALLIAVVAFWGVASPEQFSQTYDNVFHLGAISHILAGGDASSLTLRTLIEPQRAWAPYPSAWHSLVALNVQLCGVSVPVAVNATWIAVCATVWLPGVAWLAQLIARPFESGRVALIALPLGTAFGAMPYALLSWGTLYPTFLATALVPAAIAIPVAVWPPRFRVRVGRAVLAGAAGLAAVLAAIVFAQPRVLATWAVMMAPFVLYFAWRAYRPAWRAGGRHRRRAVTALVAAVGALVVAAGVGFAYVVFRLGLFERPLDDRLGGPQAKASQSVAAGISQVLGQAWPAGSTGTISFPSIPLALFVIVGIVAVWRGRRLRWALVSYLALAILFVIAAGADDVLTKLLTALWYKDRYRLSSALPVFGVAFAALGILVSARWLGHRAVRRRTGAVAFAWGTALVSALTLVVSGGSSAIAVVFALPAASAADEVVSVRQIQFLQDVGRIVPADERLLGDPWDGSAMSLLFGDREPVFPHVNGQWDPHRLLLAQRLGEIETVPEVCQALDALRVRYVVYNPHEFGGGDPIGNQFFAIHDAVGAGLFEPLLTDGESTLYRIDQCGRLPAR
ncbi:DUF6541 family protein [Microbacterium sp. B35-30]|uniref:DUF6541 family protein n=1 Tax=Microbacterium sp. B35-30 TaxID=1962642 RepID=UPI0013D043FE|nr:DUF6541 family protein [Microbacterium sp. B35-30]KAF2419969.1 hypothetical protein B2K11_03350 [Microbacterium sp. B35-30]